MFNYNSLQFYRKCVGDYFYVEAPDGQTKTGEGIEYKCDFRRCRLNARLRARIQPLLPGHIYTLSLPRFSVCWGSIEIIALGFED